MAERQLIEMAVKSVLNPVKGMPFRWSINPYRGCSHACPFCYARRTHWFLDEDGIDEWSTKIFVKINAPEVVRRELARPTWRREEVAIGTATDPYQAIESKYRLTRKILEALRDFRTPVSIVTRSPLILEDLDVLRDMARCAQVTVCISIITTDARLSRELEPTVALPAQRLRAVQRLSESGIRAGILLAPILPGITDTPEAVDAVVCAGRQHGAQFVSHNVLHLGPITRDAFLRFIDARHPGLVPRYLQMYRGKYAPDAYRAEMSQIVEASKETHGIQTRRHRAPLAEPAQLTLFTYELPRRCVQRTTARRGSAAGTAGGVSRGLTFQVNVANDGDADGPRQHVAKLGRKRLAVTAPQGLGDLPDLFNETPERAVDTTGTVAFGERRGDLPLENGKLHESPLTEGVVEPKDGVRMTRTVEKRRQCADRLN